MKPHEYDQDVSQAKELLSLLGKMNINLEILTKTRIGHTVNNLRKAVKDQEDTSSEAKDLIKKWKKFIEKQEGKTDSNRSPNNNGNNSSNASSQIASSKKDSSSKNGSSASSSKNTAPSSVNTSNSVNNNHNVNNKQNMPVKSIPADSSSSEVRGKCREMIANALKVPLPDNFQTADELDIGEMGEPDDLAEQIESAIFAEIKNTELKYKNRVRSRVSNLRDNRNPDLRLNVLRGIISPQRMAKMDSNEMASEDMKKLRDKITKQTIQEHQMAVTGGTATNLIKCPKCKKSNTTYNQVQTRSADEPMTTFCFCNECGKRWKFC